MLTWYSFCAVCSKTQSTFVRTLHGPVTALALAGGRCMNIAVNGSMWDLEGGTGAEMEEAQQVFEEGRIISADADGMHVRRFDI